MFSATIVTSSETPSLQSHKKRARFSNRPPKDVRLKDLCVLAQTHPYGILPSGNRLFDSRRPVSRLPNQWISDECWQTVLEFCDARTLGKLSQSCRTFYAISHEPSLWRDLVLRSRKTITMAGPSWKDCYVKMNHSEKMAALALNHQPMSVQGVYSDYYHRLHACRSFSIPNQWLDGDMGDDNNNSSLSSIAKIPHDKMTIQIFETQFERPNIPVLVQGAAKKWGAFKKWQDMQYLYDQVGGRTFRATSGAAPLPGNFTLKAYEGYCQSPFLEEAPLYLFDRSALAPGSPLWNDYMPDLRQTCPYWDPEREDTSHDLFKLIGEGRRPDHTWLIIGPKRSGSVFHIDPNATHAWNAAIVGRKRWIFYPPGVTPPGVLPSDDGDEVALPLSLGEWFFQFWDEHAKRKKTAPEHERPIEFTAFPGDVVFVPHGWWHLVVNLDDMNVAITHNYASGSNLGSVLKFIREKNDQVSGCRDRDESIKPEQLYDELVKELMEKYPDLTKEALARNDWNCKAWKTPSPIESTEADSAPKVNESTSVMVKAKETSGEFSFQFM